MKLKTSRLSLQLKAVLLLIVMIAAVPPARSSYAGEIGRVTRVTGITSARIEAGDEIEIKTARPIFKGSTIIAHDEALIELSLSDGTALVIYGPSMIKINNCRTSQAMPPTFISLSYGKIKFYSKNVHNSLSLKVVTPSGEISAVKSEFAVISSGYETIVAVFRYKLAVSSSDTSVKKAFIVYPGEQITVARGNPPGEPEPVGVSSSAWWIDSFYLTSSEKKISGYEKNEGPADWLIRKRSR
jgi:hypothetical protein